VPCRSLYGAKGVAVSLEGFLGILVILHEMREGWFLSDFLGGMFQAEIFHIEDILFL